MNKKSLTLIGATLAALTMLAQQNAAATPLVLGDDASENVALDFTFNFQGLDYTDVWVNSNGNLTFGSGDMDFSESTGELLSDQPRIAGLWDDLNPNTGGVVDATGDANSMLVSWDEVPEFSNSGSNTFSIELFATGTILMTFGDITATDGIVGISPGGNLLGDPGEIDFSAGSGVYGNTGVIYEHFAFGEFDLASGTTLRFEGNSQPVPEPGTLALLGLGLVGMGFARRKKIA